MVVETYHVSPLRNPSSCNNTVYPPNPPGGANNSSCPEDDRHTLCIIAVGSLTVVKHHVMQMFQQGYA